MYRPACKPLLPNKAHHTFAPDATTITTGINCKTVGTRRGRFAIAIPAIPAVISIAGLKNHLPPSIEYSKLQSTQAAPVANAETIIDAIGIGCKSIGHQVQGRAGTYLCAYPHGVDSGAAIGAGSHYGVPTVGSRCSPYLRAIRATQALCRAPVVAKCPTGLQQGAIGSTCGDSRHIYLQGRCRQCPHFKTVSPFATGGACRRPIKAWLPHHNTGTRRAAPLWYDTRIAR